MEKLIIRGGRCLKGTVSVPAAKNAVLAELAACMLCRGEIILENCPQITDVQNMLRILEGLGCRYTFVSDELIIDCAHAEGYEIPAALAAELRASIFLLGPLLSRSRKAKVAYPGGCAIGVRPINLHLKALSALNVKITEENGYLICDGSAMRPGNVHIDLPSVGATENFMLAAAGLNGVSRLENAAREPEICDLADFINAMGGRVRGAGSSLIEIEGTNGFGSARFNPIPDRIIAGTYLIGATMTGGAITLKNCRPAHLSALTHKLGACNAKIAVGENEISIESDGNPCAPGIIETAPHPGFPTDLQAQMTALASISSGTTAVIENLFEARFGYVSELVKMGADITVRGTTAIVRGGGTLHGAEVSGGDLRGAAALVLAGLKADGETAVRGVQHLDRGYYRIEEDFTRLGADIKREDL